MNSANINAQRAMQLGQQTPSVMNPQQVQLQQAQQQAQQHRRVMLAQQMLRQNPQVITETNQKPFPPNILSPMIKQNLPEGVKTWAQLKEWAGRNPALAPNIDSGKLLLLQAMHVQDLLHHQQNMNGQRIPPQSNNAGVVPNAQPGGQAPQARMVSQTVPMQARSGPQVLQGMPPHPPITSQDIQNLRARLPPAQADLPDDQLRQFITTQRVVQWKKQQAQRQMQQGPQGQANQILHQPMLQQPPQQTPRPTQAPPPQPTPTKQPNRAPQPPKSAQQPAQTNVKQGVKRPNDDVIEVSNPEQASGTITAPQAPNMMPSRSQQRPSNFTPKQMTRLNPQQPSQTQAQLHTAQELTSRAQQLPNSQQTSGAQPQNSATMDRNALTAQKDARFKMLGAEIDRTLPRNPPIPHPPEVRAQMQQWLRDYYPQLKQLDKCLLFYNRIADNPEPILKQMFEAVRLK